MRLFIALPVPKEIRDEIGKNMGSMMSSLKDAKFVPDYKWHFTLVFLGEQQEDAVPALERVIENTTNEADSFKVNIEKMVYGPPIGKPRMIWVTPNKESNKRMAELKKYLVSNLEKENISWKKSGHDFNGHITLARFEPEHKNELPKIEKKIGKRYQPSSIELIKSALKPTGAEYETIFESPLP